MSNCLALEVRQALLEGCKLSGDNKEQFRQLTVRFTLSQTLGRAPWWFGIVPESGNTLNSKFVGTWRQNCLYALEEDFEQYGGYDTILTTLGIMFGSKSYFKLKVFLGEYWLVCEFVFFQYSDSEQNTTPPRALPKVSSIMGSGQTPAVTELCLRWRVTRF